LGKEIARHKDYSEETAKRIDASMKKILEAGLKTAQSILKSHKKELEKLADALLARETLSDNEVRELIGLPAKVEPERT
jgi:cell division protease FtsH